ncbi:hypothetical protein Hanom_Chr06g00561261 [Helianthus anomalus]
MFWCRFTGFSSGGGVGVRTTVYRRRWWSLRRTGTPLFCDLENNHHHHHSPVVVRRR